MTELPEEVSDGTKEYTVVGAVTIGMEQMVPAEIWHFGVTDQNGEDVPFKDSVDKIALLALRDRAQEKGFGVVQETLRRRNVYLKPNPLVNQTMSSLVSDPNMYMEADELTATVVHMRWEIVGLPEKKEE